ncbi:hypothetical protein X975_07691, partial [Stegodyphus mimosarum]
MLRFLPCNANQFLLCLLIHHIQKFPKIQDVQHHLSQMTRRRIVR